MKTFVQSPRLFLVPTQTGIAPADISVDADPSAEAGALLLGWLDDYLVEVCQGEYGRENTKDNQDAP